MHVRLLVLVAAGALAAAFVGISAQRSAASCIAAVQFRGALYYGTTVSVTPKLGGSLGTGTVPTCTDQIVNGKPYHPIPAHRVRLTRIRGISPSLAFVAGTSREHIYVRRQLLQARQLPARIDYLVRGPRCRPADAPVTLAGPWLAVPSSHAFEQITVQRASARRYLHAKLRIHIPPRLRAKVQHAYEARARTLALVARCYRGSFIAASVTPG